MLWAIAIIFGLLWVIGLISAYTLGGYIHFLLAVSFLLFVVGAYSAGKRAASKRGSSTVQRAEDSDKSTGS